MCLSCFHVPEISEGEWLFSRRQSQRREWTGLMLLKILSAPTPVQVVATCTINAHDTSHNLRCFTGYCIYAGACPALNIVLAACMLHFSCNRSLGQSCFGPCGAWSRAWRLHWSILVHTDSVIITVVQWCNLRMFSFSDMAFTIITITHVLQFITRLYFIILYPYASPQTTACTSTTFYLDPLGRPIFVRTPTLPSESCEVSCGTLGLVLPRS